MSSDPVEGGNANDYIYPADPVNGRDLTGKYADGRSQSYWDREQTMLTEMRAADVLRTGLPDLRTLGIYCKYHPCGVPIPSPAAGPSVSARIGVVAKAYAALTLKATVAAGNALANSSKCLVSAIGIVTDVGGIVEGGVVALSPEVDGPLAAAGAVYATANAKMLKDDIAGYQQNCVPK